MCAGSVGVGGRSIVTWARTGPGSWRGSQSPSEPYRLALSLLNFRGRDLPTWSQRESALCTCGSRAETWLLRGAWKESARHSFPEIRCHLAVQPTPFLMSELQGELTGSRELAYAKLNGPLTCDRPSRPGRSRYLCQHPEVHSVPADQGAGFVLIFVIAGVTGPAGGASWFRTFPA